MTRPAARHGGTRIYCPVVDVAATERGGGRLVMCGQPSRADTRAGRRALARHCRRDHLEPFAEGTAMMLRYVASGEWGGMTGVRAEVTLSR